MLRHASYPHPQQPAQSTHRYSGTSSAFSASANPNEDWTKISDLAERRRIQNRIAQRNYRKKLKKRLEDLERRAASNSASPEQRHAELDTTSSPESGDADGSPEMNKAATTDQSGRQNAAAPQQFGQQQPTTPYYALPDDRSMFSHQFTRQLSTSPPPLSYSTYPPDTLAYAPYSHALYTAALPAEPLFAPYLPPPAAAQHTAGYPSMPAYPAKPDFFAADDELGPFSLSYASMAGIELPHAHAHGYHDHAGVQVPQIHTPPLSESFEASVAGSPPEFGGYPRTPGSGRGTPPLRLV